MRELGKELCGGVQDTVAERCPTLETVTFLGTPGGSAEKSFGFHLLLIMGTSLPLHVLPSEACECPELHLHSKLPGVLWHV